MIYQTGEYVRIKFDPGISWIFQGRKYQITNRILVKDSKGEMVYRYQLKDLNPGEALTQTTLDVYGDRLFEKTYDKVEMEV
jgi:hypothetical protein